MRGQLQGIDRLQASISNLVADVDRKREIKIPLDFELKELAWDFNGQVKFLEECSRDELLQVIKIICRRFSYLTNPTDDKSSATNIHPE
jgi:hypothetical protein